MVNDFEEKDILIKFNDLNFLNMKSGLVLGGYSYELNQYSGGSKLVCNFSNPRGVDWDNWETETLSLGMKIAEMSGNDKLKSFFS